MPYVVVKQGNKWCVYKEVNNRPSGPTHGCHATKEQARKQQDALYAAEDKKNAASSQGVTLTVMDTNGTYVAPTTYWFLPSASGAANSWTYNTTNLGKFVVSEAPADSEDRGPAFEGVLAIVGSPTSDGRYLIPNEISNRDLPIPVTVQTATEPGHMGAQSCGRIDSIDYIPVKDFTQTDEFDLGDVRDDATVVWAQGTFDTSQYAEDAQRMMENGAGVSIDLPPDRIAAFDPDTLQEVPEEEIDFQALMEGSYLIGIAGKIAALTIVSIPAFEQASIVLVPGHALIASAYGFRVKPQEVLTAAAAGSAPLDPPKEWFYTEEPDAPCALTVTPKGHVFGHLALWDQCHVAFASCERAPRSKSNYAYFHTGEIETAEHELIPVGRITVGKEGTAKGGHASVVLGRQGAMEHYDKTGCVGAFVRATNGKHGIWLSGAVRSDAPAETVRDMRANVPSGDWRDDELVAVLSVPCGGFPIPRVEALVASAENGEEKVRALIASGYSEEYEFEEEETFVDIPTYRRRMQELVARRASTLMDLAYTAEERKKMAKSGEAMPDGSFPIANCADAENAIHAQGRAKDQNAAVAHIKKRVRALGCSGKIFDEYR